MVAALGGPADLVEHWDHHLEKAAVIVPVMPEQSGYLVKMDAREIGLPLSSWEGEPAPTKKLTMRLDSKILWILMIM